MVVVMLAAEDPSLDGHLASIPRRRGNGVKPSKTNKKLVQARLPFKRLNPEPKESSEPKRTRAPLCPDPGASDGENELDRPQLSVRHGPALVNGRGPLDGFMSRESRASPAKCSIVDLTEDSCDSGHLPEPLPTTPVSASRPSTQDHQRRKDPSAGKVTRTPKTDPLKCGMSKKEEEEEEEEEEKMDTASASHLDTTQGSDSEEEEDEEEEEPVKAEMSSHGNESMLSPSSTSSLSAVESSPDQANTEPASPATDLKTTPNTGQKSVRRRSQKSLQEQEERVRQREQREREREEAKVAKEKKKEEARKQREEREKEKRERKEREEREKLEKKEKEKAEKLKAKEEQRRSKQEAKLEEKRKKEEEKRVKEEEKRLKEEKDRMKAEKSEITRFLQKPKTQQAPKTLASACGKFAPFEIKEHMCLAPLTRVQLDESGMKELDLCLEKPHGNSNKLLKAWTSKEPGRSGPTKPRQADVMRECTECTAESPRPDGVPDRQRYGHMKLLQFRENHRPAYWGTWSRKSSHITPRCPLRQDKVLLDYEVDSDDEWEEEEPGESLSHSEGDDDDEGGENDDDDDDGFFVPHGYLSDGEGALVEEEEGGGDLEKQKVRQRLKAREWDELMAKKRLRVLEAVVRGCVWEGEGPPLELFQPLAVCLLEPLPRAEASTPEDPARKHQRDEQLLSQLLPLLHGNINSSKVIITEFQEFCRQQAPSPLLSSPPSDADIPTRIRLKRLIKANAVYEKRSSYRPCWYVHTDVLVRFHQEALPVPCQWSYLTSGAQTPREETSGAATGSQGSSPTTPQASSTTTTTPTSSNKRKSAGCVSITKFMKKCADPEQTEVMETDGFQADTEDDDEDPDCVIVSNRQSGSSRGDTPAPSAEGEDTQRMEVTPSDTAAPALPCPAPTPATA
ncbi:chromatin assembly factor 1 subunit A [Osmerus eperlanus]|uniref:chromatin assembly factor 1 subunit A n=1 Tax=Osmerus eperlanus TaxID=29151 RepID=UPI002E1542D7